MDMPKNAAIDGKMCDIISPDLYAQNKQLYANTRTALEIEKDGMTYALPYRNQTDDRPGIYDAGCIYFTKFPTEEDQDRYDMSKLDIVDYSDAGSMSDYLNKNQQLRNIESEILTDVDNLFMPPIDQEDSEAMKALKIATCAKACDINKYAQRFGDNFSNTKRIFKDRTVSLKKLIEITDALDMEVELCIRDKNPDIPNPMGREVRAILTGGGDDKNV